MAYNVFTNMEGTSPDEDALQEAMESLPEDMVGGFMGKKGGGAGIVFLGMLNHETKTIDTVGSAEVNSKDEAVTWLKNLVMSQPWATRN